jgi:predicted acylesterase/phospholipase RssA
VISTVSGGSIVGALYYLRVKDLLEAVADEEIGDDDYVRIIERIERELLEAVEQHVRALTFASLRKTFRMHRADYSRSDRLGELYDELFYRPAWNDPIFGERPSPPRSAPIEMRELCAAPAGLSGSFDPTADANARRKAPVPILLLNAASLNSGHNWRFEAVGMGEPPRRVARWVEIDKNARLRWERYDRIAAHQQDFELGLAVAASACVPGLFHPLPVTGLFRDQGNVRVELVDGGVHDNQGVAGLLEWECTRLLVSDASGQLGDEPEPATRIPATLGRSANVYGDRVREEQLAGARSAFDNRLALMHLRKGLAARVIAPLGSDGEPLAETERLGEIDYGVHPRVQHLLSRMRTDLDSFTETEAHSLALYGYLMSARELQERGFPGREQALPGEWAFDVPALRAAMRQPPEHYLAHLLVAGSRFFKPLRLSRRLKLAVSAAVGGVLLALAALLYVWWDTVWAAATAPIPLAVLLLVALGAGALVAFYFMARIRIVALQRLSDWLFTSLLPGLLSPFLWLAARIMLASNGIFLRCGRLERVFPPRR